MLDAVFTYGTLQVPEVMTAVTGNVFPAQTAVLSAFRRFKIKHRVYPAIVADLNATTSGVLYTEVDQQSLALLDEFEDILYERVVVEVQAGARSIQAYAYVIADQYRHRLSDLEWDLAEFENRHLRDYLERIHAG